jgi:XTP/dITP diphosphohydrolase
MELLIATQNKDKLKEYRLLFNNSSLKLVKLPKQLICEENGASFRENAIIKAKACGEEYQQLSLADDSGLCIDYLRGAPGIHSHRFAKNGFASARQKIVNLLQAVPEKKRAAQFVCCLALFDPISSKIKTFTGRVKGRISHRAKGTRGFGYDPIFFCPEIQKTFGEAAAAEKNRVSHRARAVSQLKHYLRLTKALG